jgi:mRNA interferase MazF
MLLKALFEKSCLFFKKQGTIDIHLKRSNKIFQKRKEKVMQMNIKRGDIYYADLSPVIGSEQGGLRPVLIVQNDVGNKYSPTVIAAAITSRMSKTKLPTHIDIMGENAGLAKDSIILLEQIRTIDKKRLKEKMGHLDEATMTNVNNAIQVSFGLMGEITREG